MKLRKQLCAAALVIIAAAVPSIASAGFTSWAENNSEPEILNLLDKMYGLHNLERVHDWGDGATDEMWYAKGPMHVSVVAKYSTMSQHFGILTGDDTMGMSRLMTVNGYGMNQRESTVIDIDGGFRLATDPVGDRMGTSRMADNWNGTDQMVTWRVIGNDGYKGNEIGTTIVAFEDRPTRDSSIDYNDLVLELRRGKGDDPGEGDPGDPVPEPATLLLLGMGTAGMAIAKRRKQKS